jgi:hypothetical protein
VISKPKQGLSEWERIRYRLFATLQALQEGKITPAEANAVMGEALHQMKAIRAGDLEADLSAKQAGGQIGGKKMRKP